MGTTEIEDKSSSSLLTRMLSSLAFKEKQQTKEDKSSSSLLTRMLSSLAFKAKKEKDAASTSTSPQGTELESKRNGKEKKAGPSNESQAKSKLKDQASTSHQVVSVHVFVQYNHRKANHGDCPFSNISGPILELTRNENRDVQFGVIGIGGDVNGDLAFVLRNGTESLRNFSSVEISMFLSSTGLGQSITNSTHLTQPLLEPSMFTTNCNFS
ncbi:hypothetical protein Bca4012_069438 [Brassica carinata]